MPTAPRRAASGAVLSDTPSAPVRAQHNGWTAERQRDFLNALAESGSVTAAAASVGMSARSAYRLRARPEAQAFGIAWDGALRIAAGRLTALAFERAIVGRVRQTWKNGELVATTREPSDRLLMFLLASLNDRHYGGSATYQREGVAHASRRQLPELFDQLADSDCPTEFIQSEDLAGASLLRPMEGEEEPFDMD